jgi:hypothetical protein
VELVWQEQGSEEEKAALEKFHADGPELARLIDEFGALLLTDYLTAVPDEAGVQGTTRATAPDDGGAWHAGADRHAARCVELRTM